ncbi:MAG: hypothetical protein HY042_04220 [Spirochaetia bacterium]|nr:hypothetical protein [Spirochaetia bacterium]
MPRGLCHPSLLPMEEMEFDRTRKAIGAQDLEEQARRDLAGKFQQAGGQVIRERSVKKAEIPARSQSDSRSQREPSSSSDALPTQRARQKQREESDRVAQLRRQYEDEIRASTSFIARFGIKLRCKLAGLTPFGRNVALPKFLSKINLNAKRALMECNILGNELLINNAELSKSILEELDRRNPIYVELIDYAMKMYDRIELAELTARYNDDPRAVVPLDAIRAPLFSLLRKLYYMKMYQETFRAAVDQAIDVQQKVEKKQAALYTSKKKKVFGDWDSLMNDVFPALVLIAQRIEMRKADPGTRIFDEMVGARLEDRPGKRRAGDPILAQQVKKPAAQTEEQKTEEAAKEVKEEEKPEETAEEAAPADPFERHFAHGAALLAAVSVPQLRQKYATRNEWAAVSDRDKVLITVLLLMQFEDEYSFILTTPKIQLNPIHVNGMKVDFRQKMADIFRESRSCYDAFKKYVQECEEYQKTYNEHPSGGNYVEHAKRVSLLESRRGVTGRAIRTNVKNYMSSVRDTLGQLIEDMRTSRRIVNNMDEPVKFDMQIESKKRLQGRPVKECIQEAFCYALAASRRIEKGDLFGGVLEMSEEEFNKGLGSPAASPDVMPF